MLKSEVKATIKIIQAPPVCSIQDKGRFGYRNWGIPQSGYMDPIAAQWAHTLVGNPPDGALIEFALGELVIEANRPIEIAVVGSGDPKKVRLCANDPCILSASLQNYSYLAIAGDLQASLDFESKSTYPPAGLGGMDGAYLKPGDQIAILPLTNQQISQVPEPSSSSFIRILKGPEWHLLQEDLEKVPFKISNEANRMAIRLEGKVRVDADEMKSSTVVPGVIQLPPGGSPIVLMRDCQTTGGYPRIAKVVDQDLGRLAQMPFGANVAFRLAESV